MTEMVLPQFGMGMADGTITVWHKAEGDRIEIGELLCDVEAAKTTVEVSAPSSGILQRIIVPAGQNVPVNTVIALIGDTMLVGEDDVAIAPVMIPSSAYEPALVPRAEEIVAEIAAPMPKSPIPSTNRADKAVQIEPRARRAARLLGIDLTFVSGTGPGGRITERDVVDASNAPVAVPAAASFATQVATTLVPQFTPASIIMHQLQMRCDARPLIDLLSQFPLCHDIKIPVPAALLRATALAAAKALSTEESIGLRSDAGDVQIVFNPAELSILGIAKELDAGNKTKRPAPTVIIDWNDEPGLNQIVSLDSSVPVGLSFNLLEGDNQAMSDQWNVVLTTNQIGPSLADAKQLLLLLRQLLMQPLSILA